ncbi:MAG: alginate export family protein [Gammaproteobacteria bacterium]|nr:alginate export family protein [Gammaproteobacteria bacterium]
MRRIIAFNLFLFLITSVQTANAEDRFGDALSNGEFDLSFRYRYEFVEEDPFAKDAKASTLRTRLTYESAEFLSTKFLLEFSNVSSIGNELYNSTRNDVRNRPIVADPTGTEVNRAQFLITAIPKSDLTLGRQRINLDNQRFIGGVAWRQNEQTYDAVRFINHGVDDTALQVGYLSKVHRVFGPDSGTPTNEFDSDSPYLHVHYSGWGVGALSVYGYFLDLENAPDQSNQTVGARFVGKYDWSKDRTLGYAVEYAYQQDYEDNPSDYSASYTLLEGEFTTGRMTAHLGYAVLSGSSNRADHRFITPLATLHKFQGWADKFLITPPAGVEDLYFGVSGSVSGFQWSVRYHDFDPEAGDGRYGEELDLSMGKSFLKRYNVLVKFADYNAKDIATDTTKFWVQLTANFL